MESARHSNHGQTGRIVDGRHTMDSLLAAGEIQFGNVLFVTDFSTSSELALPYAVALAAQYSGKVYIAHVISPEMFEFLPPALLSEIGERIKTYARKRMDELVNETSFGSVPHEVLLEEGEIWETLKAAAAKYSIDVVALGTHGRCGVQKLLMGAVAEETLRLAQRPVLTVGPQSHEFVPERRPRNILFAADFSTDCVRAMNCAFSLAHRFAARLITVHVVSNVAEDPQTLTRFEQFFIQRLRELVSAPPGLQQEFRVEFGSPAECILKVAADAAIDLIVMGVRGAGSLDRADRHFGTTAYRVVSEARCPVLTARG
ncbi:MAG: universal stress protein [Terriglobales bacterium]